jgi:hypothetical protein
VSDVTISERVGMFVVTLRDDADGGPWFARIRTSLDVTVDGMGERRRRRPATDRDEVFRALAEWFDRIEYRQETSPDVLGTSTETLGVTPP